MKPINIYNQKWVPKCVPGNWEHEAISFWPFILYGSRKNVVPPNLRRHEEYHWNHQLRWLVIPWYVAYGLMWLKYGYLAHPWERLAREAEHEHT